MKRIYSSTAFLYGCLIVLVALVVLMLAACQSNPLSAAQSLDQKAFALYGTFVVYEETAAKAVQSPDVPEAAKALVRSADQKAKPVADSLLAAVQSYEQIQAQVSAGATSADKLAIATSNLQQWVNQLTPLVKNLVSSVKGASQ